MPSERRSQVAVRGRLYSSALAVAMVVAIVVAGSALYIATGGHLFGMGAGTFGVVSARSADGSATLQRAREAAWAGRHAAAVVAYDSVLAVRPGDHEVAAERARVLAWAEDYSAAADALAALAPVPGDSAESETALQRARYLWWSGRSREADSLLSVIRAEHPTLPEAAELQALIRPSVEPVVEVAARWVAERPDDPWANLWLARALVAERRAAESLVHYRRALGEPGEVDPEILLEAAGVALGTDSLALAGQLLSLYLRDIDPPDWQTRLRLARSYSWGGRYTAATEQYRIVLEQAPDHEVRLELARMLASAGRLPAAIVEYRQVLGATGAAGSAPSSARVRRELADVLARSGRYDEAAVELAGLLAGGESVDLLLELARLRALAERYGEAADLLGRALDVRPDHHAARLERARFLWWAGRLEAADAELTRLLAAVPDHAEARALRAEVRPGITPSVDLAGQWLAADDSRANRLHLARALVRAGQLREALAHYEAALGDATDRELVIDAADVADAADAPDRRLAILERHRAAVETPAPDMTLRLARAYGWAGRHDEAVRTYAAYLAERPADLDARLERARQLAWGDTTGHAEARTELARVVEADTARAEALQLLGDLARWSGDGAAALAYYRRAQAIDPGLDTLDESMELALAMRDTRVVPRDATQVSWAIEADAYSDTEGFDWAGSGIRREWRFGESALSVRFTQGYSRGRLPAGVRMGRVGLGAVLGGRMPVAPGVSLLAEIGAMSFDDIDAFATWGAGLDYDDGPSRARLWYGRSPAVRDAATMAALEAGAVLDRVQVTAGRDMGPWRVATDLQLQRFSADVGNATRHAGMVRVDRDLGDTGVAVGGLVRGVFATERAPVLPAWGRLYWTPDHYIAPALSITYGTTIAEGLWLGLRAAPGIAFIDEGDDGVSRYDRDRTAILETGATVGYHTGRWRIELSGDWGGAVPDGYNASSLRFQLSRSGGPR